MTDKPLFDFAKKLMAFDGQDVRAVNAIDAFETSPDFQHPEDPLRQRLMRGVQEGLKQLGFKVPQTGIADATTAQAIVSAVSPRWRWMSWRNIYQALKESLGQ